MVLLVLIKYSCCPALQTELSQIEHLLQTAEAIRRDGKPEWMQVRQLWTGGRKELNEEQVTGLVHDLGKLLYVFGSECVLGFATFNRACV